MFTGPVGPVEVFLNWPEANFGNFYWPVASGSLLALCPGSLWFTEHHCQGQRGPHTVKAISKLDRVILVCGFLDFSLRHFFSHISTKSCQLYVVEGTGGHGKNHRQSPSHWQLP